MARRIPTALSLRERGHAERIFLSADSCASLDWFAEETVGVLMREGAVKDWTITLVHDRVLPALREGGMTGEQERTMMGEEPQALAGAVGELESRSHSRVWCKGCTRPFQGLSSGSIPDTRL